MMRFGDICQFLSMVVSELTRHLLVNEAATFLAGVAAFAFTLDGLARLTRTPHLAILYGS